MPSGTRGAACALKPARWSLSSRCPSADRQSSRTIDVNYQFDFGPVLAGFPDLLRGCAGTMLLALSGMVLATIIGIGGVMLRDSRYPPVRWLVKAFV